MNKKNLLLLMSALTLCSVLPAKEFNSPLAPKEYRRSENTILEAPSKLSLKQMYDKYYLSHSALAKKYVDKLEKTNAEGFWKPTEDSIDSHKAPEWFLDAKFGMFIDYGLWSVAGWAPKREKKAMYPDWYEYRIYTHPEYIAYHKKNWGDDFKPDHFIPLFKADKFDADKIVKIAKDSGMKYVVPFFKHHSGYCFWQSSFSKRNTVDMTPNKDLVMPIKDACKKYDLKFGFYFSVDEWEYPIIQENGEMKIRSWKRKGEDGEKIKMRDYDPEYELICSGKVPVKDFINEYLLPQGVELIDKYKPDLLWYDGEWFEKVEDLRTYDLSAYYYNTCDKLNGGVAVNDRYGLKDDKMLRVIRGDYYTNEYGDNDKKISFENAHPWEECRGISQSFGFNWQDDEGNVISASEFVSTFVDIVAKGGTLLLIVNLDKDGALPEVQEKRLKEIGAWLKKNGEAIYATRQLSPFIEDGIAYTRSKDSSQAFAIIKNPKEGEVAIKISPKKENKIQILGTKKDLKWRAVKNEKSEGITIVTIPDGLDFSLPIALKIENEQAKHSKLKKKDPHQKVRIRANK